MDLTPHQIAQVVHAANAQLRMSLGEMAPGWFSESKEKRASIERGVLAMIEHPCGPEESHERWRQESANLSHRNNVPYSDLSFEQRRKDSLFSAIVLVLSISEADLQESTGAVRSAGGAA